MFEFYYPSPAEDLFLIIIIQFHFEFTYAIPADYRIINDLKLKYIAYAIKRDNIEYVYSSVIVLPNAKMHCTHRMNQTGTIVRCTICATKQCYYAIVEMQSHCCSCSCCYSHTYPHCTALRCVTSGLVRTWEIQLTLPYSFNS